MAPKKSIANKSSTSSQEYFVSQLVKECNIPDNIKIRPLTTKEENRWRISGIGDENTIVLGRRHIETIRLPIHSMILQFISALQIHPMQLTPNSLKFIVAAIILNEVEGKGITINDLLSSLIMSRKPFQTKLSQLVSHLLPLCLQEALYVYWQTSS